MLKHKMHGGNPCLIEDCHVLRVAKEYASRAERNLIHSPNAATERECRNWAMFCLNFLSPLAKELEAAGRRPRGHADEYIRLYTRLTQTAQYSGPGRGAVMGSERSWDDTLQLILDKIENLELRQQRRNGEFFDVEGQR